MADDVNNLNNLSPKPKRGTHTPNKGMKYLNGKRYGDEVMLKALIKSNGHVATAAHQLGCSISAVRSAIYRNEKIADTVEKLNKVKVEKVIDVTYREALKGESWACQLWAKGPGKEYGFGDSPTVIVPMQQTVINQEVKSEDDPYNQASILFQSMIDRGAIPDELLHRLNGDSEAILIGSNGHGDSEG